MPCGQYTDRVQPPRVSWSDYSDAGSTGRDGQSRAARSSVTCRSLQQAAAQRWSLSKHVACARSGKIRDNDDALYHRQIEDCELIGKIRDNDDALYHEQIEDCELIGKIRDNDDALYHEQTEDCELTGKIRDNDGALYHEQIEDCELIGKIIK